MTGPNVYDTPGHGETIRVGPDRSGRPADRDTAEPRGLASGRDPDRRGIFALVGDLIHESTTLVRQEIDLARAEMSQKMGQAGRGSIMLATGGLIAFAGLLFLLLAAVYALSRELEPWLAALIVGAATLILGLIVLAIGRSRLSGDALQPKRTMAALQEDRDWARSQISRRRSPK